jgi:5'-phosphate synthase pdxT subunit
MIHPHPDAAIVIGILGAQPTFFSPQILPLTLPLALQGAFIEHQDALQKISLQKEIQVLQVRTAEELTKCAALVIPGGGLYRSSE